MWCLVFVSWKSRLTSQCFWGPGEAGRHMKYNSPGDSRWCWGTRAWRECELAAFLLPKPPLAWVQGGLTHCWAGSACLVPMTGNSNCKEGPSSPSLGSGGKVFSGWPRRWRISQNIFQAMFQFVDLFQFGDLQTVFVELELRSFLGLKRRWWSLAG